MPIPMPALYPNLKSMMDENGLTYDDLAVITGRSVEDVFHKMDGTLEWSIYDAVLICRYLRYPDLRLLFVR